MRLFVSLVCVLLLSGCGSSGARHHLKDRDATLNAFLSAVPEYYATRSDGKLSEPIQGTAEMRFRYTYNQVKNGNFIEEVKLMTYGPRPNGNYGAPKGQPTFAIGAWWLKDGPDVEIADVQQEIERRVLEKLSK